MNWEKTVGPAFIPHCQPSALVVATAFRLDALSYVFQSGDARMWVGTQGSLQMMASLPNAGITIAAPGILGTPRR